MTAERVIFRYGGLGGPDISAIEAFREAATMLAEPHQRHKAAMAALAAELPPEGRQRLVASLAADPLYLIFERIEELAGDLDAADAAVRQGECRSVAPLVEKLRQRIGDLGLHLMRLGTEAAIEGRKRDKALELVAAGKACWRTVERYCERRRMILLIERQDIEFQVIE
jgi:hypothetical protein